LLSLVPWVASHPDGVRLEEICSRFQIKPDVLRADLDSLLMVGLPPHTPDMYVDVILDEDRVTIQPQWFDRPLRLTPEQALALVTSGASLLAVPGADPAGPLARGLAKLAEALGVPDASTTVDLGAAPTGVLDLLLEARRARTTVDIDYYAFGRDLRSRRTIEPWHVYNELGAWYVQAWCHQADGERVFRVDRIAEAASTGEQATAVPGSPTLGVFRPAEDDPQVTLALAPEAAWVVEQYPCRDVVEHDDGTVEVTLTVTAVPWFERLLVRLGPAARMLGDDTEDGLAGVGRDAADRIAARYLGVPAGVAPTIEDASDPTTMPPL